MHCNDPDIGTDFLPFHKSVYFIGSFNVFAFENLPRQKQIDFVADLAFVA